MVPSSSRCSKNKDAKDPAAARRAIVDAFADLRILPENLDEYLGHPFDQASPAEMDELRAAYMTVKDGEAKWMDLVEVQKVKRGEVDKGSKASDDAATKVSARLAQVKAKKAQPEKPVVDVKAEEK